MLARFFWQPWTSAPVPPESSIPFGPLRFRGWTSAPVPAESGIPFGPLRFRAWTSDGAIVVPPVVPPTIVFAGQRFPFPLPGPDGRRRLLQDDEEVIAAICAWLVAKGKG